MMALSVGREIGVNIPAGDDFASWCMAAMAFLGLAHTFKSGEMIRVGLLIDRFRGGRAGAFEIVSLVLGVAFIGFFAWHAVRLRTINSWRFNDMAQGVLADAAVDPAARLCGRARRSCSSPSSTSSSTCSAAASRATRSRRRRPPKRWSSAPSQSGV